MFHGLSRSTKLSMSISNEGSELPIARCKGSSYISQVNSKFTQGYMTYKHRNVSKVIRVSADKILDQSDHHIDFEYIRARFRHC